MTPWRLIARNLCGFARTGMAVALALATATAVITGSLLVGDSVRGSLRDTALARLGAISTATVGSHAFREALAGSDAPLLQTRGALTAENDATVPRVQVYGVEGRFWALFGTANPVNGRQAAQQLWMHDLVHHQARQQGGGAIEAQLMRPATGDVVVRVQPERRHQTILGFGGITLAPAYRLLSAEGQRQWWQLLRDYNLLLHREYPMGAQLNTAMDNWEQPADAVPHYYGDNFPNSEVCDFAYLKQLRSIGGRVMFEFWKLPPWAEQEVAKYAAAIVRYCQLSQEKTGRAPEIVGIQNEVRQPAEKFQAMTLALRQALDAAGFRDVQIHMADSAVLSAGLGYLKDFQARPEVWRAIDYAATHMYDYQQAFTDPDRFDALLRQYRAQAGSKPVLSTELCVNDGRFQTDSYRVALQLGQLYHKNLVLMDATALAYCWLLLNVEQPSFGMTRSLFVPDLQRGGVPVASSAQLRVFGAYSRKIKQGMVRVEAESPDADVLTTAFAGKDGRATVVVLNRSLHPVRVAIAWPGVTFTSTETCSPYAPNSAGAADQRLVPPGGILTLTNVEK